MKKSWLTGALLFLSLAVNVTLGAMLLGKSSRPLLHSGRIILSQLQQLPEPQRSQAQAVFRRELPNLRELAAQNRQLRRDNFRYIASADYTRPEAEKRLSQLRDQTAALQTAAQKLMLDVADTLPPEQRAQLLKHTESTLP